MRRKLAVLAGLALGVTLVRALTRRRRAVPLERPADPRTEELRRKLAASRETRVEPPAPEVTVEERPALPTAIDEARRRVHAEARRSIDDMERSGEPPTE
jgi:hypothetical protein